jgi:hypothetical protein
MTAVDINADTLKVPDTLAAARRINVRSFNGTFLQAPDDRRYDLILFYESFHHCLHFDTALTGMRQRLNPGGAILARACRSPSLGVAVRDGRGTVASSATTRDERRCMRSRLSHQQQVCPNKIALPAGLAFGIVFGLVI